jgi:ParB family chromosome partitioning protein
MAFVNPDGGRKHPGEPMTVTEPRPELIEYIDPRRIREHHLNPRSDLGDHTWLVENIRELGVLEPVGVVRDASDPAYDYVAIWGHRRVAAAIIAEKRVPAVVRDDLDGDIAGQLVAQACENLHRKNFDEAEEAVAFHQLAAFSDWDPAQIAAKVGVPAERVDRGIAVGANKTALSAAQDNGLNLMQAAALVEFDGDDPAVELLLKAAAASPRQFDHELSRRRQERENKLERDRLVAEHTAAGIRLLETEPPGYDSSALDVPRLVLHLANSEGEDLDEGHANCPGHAIYIEDGWNAPTARSVCIDPQAHGHRLRHATTARAARTPDLARSEVTANNKLWRAAEEVRRSHIAEVLAAKKIPKGTLRFVAQEILTTPKTLGDTKPAILAELTHLEADDRDLPAIGQLVFDRATERTMVLALLAQVAAARETRMPVDTWRYHRADEARWLEFLRDATGYELSEIEQRVINIVTKAKAKAKSSRPRRRAEVTVAADDAAAGAGEVVAFPGNPNPVDDEGIVPGPPDAA